MGLWVGGGGEASYSYSLTLLGCQFFITATSDAQRPVLNKIGAALVDRIVQAHNQGEPYRVVVVMPAVPAFAGDLKDDSALGTRAVMEFQYSSICRSEHSILEALKRRGIPDPSRYIGFYNLRNYDRINVSTTMQAVEAQAGPGVTYERARKEHDDLVGAGYGTRGYGTGGVGDAYRRYQEAAAKYPVRDETPDTVVSCYMHGGPDIRSVPWHGSPESELDAFVSEELYVHSKVLIADDRIVICGSANLNDRSQVGNHDSEIAAIIEDPTPVETYMAGRPFTASRFAASLRRYVFRKHLGLLKHQAVDAADANWTPVSANPNTYDFGSPEDRIVRDPLSPEFLELWRRTATTNTEVFSRAFHCVPNDHVKTWEDYDNFFAKYFIIPGSDPKKIEEDRKAGKVEYGHVVRSEFPGGVAELKDQLARIRGTLVDMPLLFLSGVDDIAKENLTSFNKLTDELYT